MFSKILIANRGEIAVRIIRACKEMGIHTVSIFSEADRNAMHVSLADESYCIGPSRVSDSYLNMEAILTVAIATGAQAIHPGYGLLSENSSFAAMCEECGIIFIGPKSDIIEKMGDKEQARRTMKNAGVPLVPGCDLLENFDDAKKKAKEIGYPVLLKARSGGGGRGIRLAQDEKQMEKSFLSASQESKSAFGDDKLYLEKFLSPIKHIEVQVLADVHGNIVCFPERECSMQRKNQKLIEESPSLAVTEQLRAELLNASKKAVEAVNYIGVGTVEFLLDKDKNFYFCEMNTRLQVEHPVTEMVTGIDIVKWQIRVAAGIALNFSQKDIKIMGHSIECRINAENPKEDFKPSCGTINLFHTPGGPWVRFDSAIYQEDKISPFYDSLIGKLIVFAPEREEAIRKMRCALCELVIEGIEQNTEFQLELLSDLEFLSGEYHTRLIEQRRK